MFCSNVILRGLGDGNRVPNSIDGPREPRSSHQSLCLHSYVLRKDRETNSVAFNLGEDKIKYSRVFGAPSRAPLPICEVHRYRVLPDTSIISKPKPVRSTGAVMWVH